MDKKQDRSVLKGYLEGYKDGFRDGRSGIKKEEQYREFKLLPINMMPLTTRARNCLTAAGCVSVADVVDMEESKIARIRNLGKKTAKEIGVWLVENGIFDSAWSLYL